MAEYGGKGNNIWYLWGFKGCLVPFLLPCKNAGRMQGVADVLGKR